MAISSSTSLSLHPRSTDRRISKLSGWMDFTVHQHPMRMRTPETGFLNWSWSLQDFTMSWARQQTSWTQTQTACKRETLRNRMSCGWDCVCSMGLVLTFMRWTEVHLVS